MEGYLTLVIGFTDTSMIGFPVLGLIGEICNDDPFRLPSPRLPRGHGAAFWKTFGARSREAFKVPARRLGSATLRRQPFPGPADLCGAARAFPAGGWERLRFVITRVLLTGSPGRESRLC
jgi:hypothetical protein